MYDEIVGHADTVRLHWMSLAVVIVADCGLVEVRDTALLRIGTGGWKRRAAVYGGRVHGPLLWAQTDADDEFGFSFLF